MFTSGHVIDVILGLMLLEAAFLARFARRKARDGTRSWFLWTLASGACLLLALRAALVGAAWYFVAACLAAALGAHVIDLATRLSESQPAHCRVDPQFIATRTLHRGRRLKRGAAQLRRGR